MFVPEMTFTHLPPTPKNRDAIRQPLCLAVDPGRCEFWRVQKNSAWGHCHLHNPPDIFPCSLIKLFTSLAPNYFKLCNTQSVHYHPLRLNLVETPNVTFPFRMANRRNKQSMAASDDQRFQTNHIFPPLSTLSDISYCLGILATFEEQSSLRERKCYHWKNTILRQWDIMFKWSFQGKLVVVVISRALLQLLRITLKDNCRWHKGFW